MVVLGTCQVLFQFTDFNLSIQPTHPQSQEVSFERFERLSVMSGERFERYGVGVDERFERCVITYSPQNK